MRAQRVGPVPRSCFILLVAVMGATMAFKRVRICFFILLLIACHPHLSCTPSFLPPPRHVFTFQLQRAKEDALRSYVAHDVAT